MLNTNVYSVRYLKIWKVQTWSDLKLVLTYKLVHIDVQLEDGPRTRLNKVLTIVETKHVIKLLEAVTIKYSPVSLRCGSS